MEIEIKTNKKNELLKRTFIEGKVKFEATTPSNNEFLSELAKKIKSDITLLVIKQILVEFGKKEANFKAYLYDSLEAKQKNEKMTKHLKKIAQETAKKIAEEKKNVAETVAKLKEEKESIQGEKA